jgi:hypothetical protein
MKHTVLKPFEQIQEDVRKLNILSNILQHKKTDYELFKYAPGWVHTFVTPNL